MDELVDFTMRQSVEAGVSVVVLKSSVKQRQKDFESFTSDRPSNLNKSESVKKQSDI